MQRSRRQTGWAGGSRPWARPSPGVGAAAARRVPRALAALSLHRGSGGVWEGGDGLGGTASPGRRHREPRAASPLRHRDAPVPGGVGVLPPQAPLEGWGQDLPGETEAGGRLKLGEPGAVAVRRVSAYPCCPPLPPTQWGGSLLAAPRAGINPLVPVCSQVPQRTSPTGPKNTPNPARLGNVPSGILRKNSPATRNGGTEADAQILELNQQLMDLKLTVDGLEKERDFYFSKLRDIELICQEHENENSPIITGIVSVLYATEEGFAPPEDDELEEQPPEDQDEY
uniref:microtubule-associated protein RP/EB family member 3 n=1 Tax=Lonchura striata TaxID=40157 RepID=UPI000B4CEC26|nr:microtubule-associated protein RP/EB family member 3 [Lonchura striata domestica]